MSTGVNSHSFLQGIFPTQGSSLGLLHCKQIVYYLSYQGSQWLGTHTVTDNGLGQGAKIPKPCGVANLKKKKDYSIIWFPYTLRVLLDFFKKNCVVFQHLEYKYDF